MSKHEEFKLHGDDLLHKVKELIREGNVRRITLLDKEGKVIIEMPLTIGVVGTVLAPGLAGIGAIAALITDCTLVVERDEP